MMQSALDPQSLDAVLIENLWWAMFAVGTAILLVVMALLFYGITRTRGAGPERPLGERRSWLLILAGGVIAPLVAVLALVVSGVFVTRSTGSPRSEASVTVQVEGRRWWWELHYLDQAGRRIATTANEIHIPVERPVRLLLRSDNVIHSFWVPSLQGKTDLIPGQPNESWLRAERPGIYRGQCAEFCGIQHALMGLLVIAEPEEEFRSWLLHQSRPADEVTDPLLARGRNVFFQSGCPACHTIRGTPALGEIGPDLTHLASRRTLAAATVPNTRGYLGGWILDPQHVKPGNLMPPTVFETQDFQALLAFLESLQ